MGAVGVDEEHGARHAAQEVWVDPVAVATVVVHPEGEGANEQQIGDGQVGHVDADLSNSFGLAYPLEDEQDVAVSQDARDEDDAIEGREKRVAKLQEVPVGSGAVSDIWGWWFYFWDDGHVL